MNSKKWPISFAALLLLASFFLPWVKWEGASVNGHALATGHFFAIAETQLGLVNPFPKLSFTFYAFLLIPVLSGVIICLSASGKKIGWLPFITGFISITLVAVYAKFTQFGLGSNFIPALQIGAWLHFLAAIALILLAEGPLLKKILFIIAGPVIVWIVFAMIEKQIMGETHKQTEDVKADYTMTSDELIKEFTSSDSSANKKYFEKVLVVNGPAASVQLLADSTSTIRFGDSTASYAIFSLEKSELSVVSKIKPGDAVSLKGVCSGSIYSDILSTTSISFKRGLLIKK